MIRSDRFEERAGVGKLRLWVSRDFRGGPGAAQFALIRTHAPHGYVDHAHFEMVRVEDPHVELPPGFGLSREGVQELMDEMWSLGFRPSSAVSEEGVRQAMSGHLDDLRKIAFHALKLKES